MVRTEFTPRPEHIGFQQTIHGGIISTLLDEIMVWACAVQTAQFAFCAELNVRFVSPARPGRPLVATAELVANRRARLFEAKAELREENGMVLATATGKYLPLKADGIAEMARDLVGDMSAILRTKP